MNYKEYFTTDNKSGWKTKESTLKKNNPELYQIIITYADNHGLTNLSFKEKIWHFINESTEIKHCLNCNETVKFKGNLTKGYSDFCSLKCANDSGLLKNRIMETNKKKHGVDWYPEHSTFIEKQKSTKKRKYGNENYNNHGQSLKTKEEKYGSSNYVNKEKWALTVRNNLLKRLSNKTKDKVIKYDIGDSNLKMLCNNCNQEYDIYNNLLNTRLLADVSPCTICNPISDVNSIKEKELVEFVKTLLPTDQIIEKDRKLIKPFELDILIPSYNLGIEFNGLYWHSDDYLHDYYHLNKTKMCENNNIRLIHIFEDEWINKKDIVKSIIKSAIGKIDTIITARKCVLKEVSTADSRVFLNSNHLQGYVAGSHNIGLYYENELVSLAVFGRYRKALGSKNTNGNYELYRFCNKLNTTVTGGFEKLFKNFIKTYKPNEITSYSDNRYFSGKIYKASGFKLTSETKPNYFYIINHQRENRFKYRKDILVKKGYDKNKSEREIMKTLNIPRIYDCGNKKWVFKL